MQPLPQRTIRQAAVESARADPRLDTNEYVRPLYPPDNTGPVGMPGRRRPQDTGERPGPAAWAGREPVQPLVRPAPAIEPSTQRMTPVAPPAARADALGLAGGAKTLRGPKSRGSGRPADAASAAGSVAARRPKKPGSAKPRGGVKPGAAVKARVAVKPRPAAKPGAGASRSRAGGRRLTKAVARLPRRVMVVSGCLIVAVVAAAAYLLLRPQAAHVVSTPSRLGAFANEPSVDSSTARALRNKIVAGAAGEVKNVVAAVYEQTTGPGTSQGPQIVVFIGGNLTGGGSASGFIGGFMTQLHGSFTTNPGHLRGQAACAPGSNGGPAECAWADNDTFGVVVSATLSADGLANEMRLMRPQVEHTAK